jgi:hypothetical protein
LSIASRAFPSSARFGLTGRSRSIDEMERAPCSTRLLTAGRLPQSQAGLAERGHPASTVEPGNYLGACCNDLG